MKILEDYGFDGIDIDWEYPKNDEEAVAYVALLREVRLALDAHGQTKRGNPRFLLTVSSLSSELRNMSLKKLLSPTDRRALWFRTYGEASNRRDGSISQLLESDGLWYAHFPFSTAVK